MLNTAIQVQNKIKHIERASLNWIWKKQAMCNTERTAFDIYW